MGCVNSNVFKKEQTAFIRSQLKIENNAIVILENIQETVTDVMSSLTKEEQKSWILKQIKYLFKSSEDYKMYLLSSLVETCFELEFVVHALEDTLIERMLDCYVIETQKNKEMNFLHLKEEATGDVSIKIRTFLKKTFVPKDGQKSTVSKVIFSLCMFIFEHSDNDELINNMTDHMHRVGIVSVFSTKPKRKSEKIKLVFQTNDDVEEITQLERIDERKDLLDSFIEDCGVNNISKSNECSFDENELVRLFHGLFKYSESGKRLKSILYDFTYGFYPVRNDVWIKNKIQKLFPILLFLGDSEDQKGEKFCLFIQKVRNWSPEKFSRENRLEYLNRNGISFTEEMQEKYFRLLQIDLEAHSNSESESPIQTIPYSTIFYKVVKNAEPFRTKREIIEKWSQKFSTPDFLTSFNSLLSKEQFIIDIKAVLQRKGNRAIPTSDVAIQSENNVSVEHPAIVAKDLEANSNKKIDNDDANRGKSSVTSASSSEMSSGKGVVKLKRIKAIKTREIYDEKEVKITQTENIASVQQKETESEKERVHDNQNVILESNSKMNVDLRQIIDPELKTSVIQKLNKKYRYKKFLSSVARCDIAPHHKRINKEEWCILFNSLIEDNYVSEIKLQRKFGYKINLKSFSTGSFITHHEIKNTIVSILNREKISSFTVKKIMEEMPKDMQPAEEELKNFLEDMVSEKELKFIDQDGLRTYSFE